MQIACYLVISAICAIGWYYLLPPPSYPINELNDWLNSNIIKERPIRYYSQSPIAFTQATKPTTVDKNQNPDIIIQQGDTNLIEVDAEKVIVFLNDIKVCN